MIIFRENMEDVYAGIEWQQGSKEAVKLREFINKSFQKNIPANAGLGIKPISESNSKRLVRRRDPHALDHNPKSVTLVHKGNIMKFTEGAFRQWGYELAARSSANQRSRRKSAGTSSTARRRTARS